MARVIANGVVEVRFGAVANPQAPTSAEVNAATDLTEFLNTIDPGVTGTAVDVPNFKRKFVPSIPGTYSASLTAEFYRDDATDTAWNALPRETQGNFIVMTFGKAVGRPVEVYPVRVMTRTPIRANGESQRFSIECSVTAEPLENGTLPAGV